ncbi:MAG: Structural maintenance of chromosomes protein 6 [Cirrosporium novae-zelandiae]|nr:MAG: Structural maintenance of chromosomes protein 6 [Cirrosporium novae-zelandiae]
MAPLKRFRSGEASNDGDGDFENLQQETTARKRARLSEVASQATGETRTLHDDNSSDDEDSSSDENDTRSQQDDVPHDLSELPTFLRREQAKEPVWDKRTTREEQLEELATQRATQRNDQRAERLRGNLQNSIAEAGVVESIQCINFMCHSNLRVTLGPLINFIVGQNGSGKSAVLTGLTICLGGKATSTNRGGKLSKLIKTGEESGSVTVKLKNTGSSAYRHDVYGDSISVERYFTINGQSGFKLRSEMGRIISTKKAELQEIIDYFALQFDNPMNILSQDLARQFIGTSNPSEKYRYFVKGTQLEQLDQDYRLLEETTELMNTKLGEKHDVLDSLKNKKLEAAERLRQAQRLTSLRAKITERQHQMAWAQVEEQEKVRDDVRTEFADAERNIHEAEAKAETLSRAFEDAERRVSEAEDAAKALWAEVSPIEKDKEKENEEYVKKRSEMQKLLSEQRIIGDEIRSANSKIQKFKAEIEEELRRLEEINGGSHARKVQEFEEKQTETAEARRVYERHRENAHQLQMRLRDAEKAVDEAMRPIDAKEQEIRQCEDRLRTLMKDQGHQQTTAFPRNIDTLLRAIRQETRFSEAPVGPVAHHIRLLKPQWSSILETSFGGILNGFVVTSKGDQSILSAIMRKVGCQCPILIGNKNCIDTSDHEPSPEFQTILRIVQIDNELVRNQLIITQGIEQTLLIENRSEAHTTMFEGERLRNVKQCFCMNPHRRGAGVRFYYTGFGEAASGYIRPYPTSPRMKTDTEAQINFQRQTLQQLQQEKNTLEQQFRQTRNNVKLCKQEIVRHQQQENDLKVRWQQAEAYLGPLQDAIDADVGREARLDTLKEELKRAEASKSLNEGQYTNNAEEREAVKEQLRAYKAKLDEFDVMIEQKSTGAREADVDVTMAANHRQTTLREKNRAFEGINHWKGEKLAIEGKLQEMDDRVANFIEGASKVSERVNVPPNETAATLDQKLERLMKELETWRKTMKATPEQLEIAAYEAESQYETAKKQFHDHTVMVQELKKCRYTRREKWTKIRQYIVARARIQMIHALSNRAYRGKMLVDHNKRELDIHVEPDETKEGGGGRDTKTLSGGEKSFSTICLLLSLWEAMGAPIRGLDEFDVFMDAANRKVSLGMIVEFARLSSGRQFIIITPQDIPTEFGPDVKITRMRAPERGQQTIAF